MDCHMFGFMSSDANAIMSISLLETVGELEVQNQDFFFLVSVFHFVFFKYQFPYLRNDLLYSDAQVWANSTDPDQTAKVVVGSRLIRVYTVCIFWTHYYMENYTGQILGIFMTYTDMKLTKYCHSIG